MLPTPHTLHIPPTPHSAIAAVVEPARLRRPSHGLLWRAAIRLMVPVFSVLPVLPVLSVLSIASIFADRPAAAAAAEAAADAAAPRQITTPQGSIELIAATAVAAAPSARGEVWLGLRFRLEQGWHTYWRNPGDSGGPATVRWTLPDGVTADAPVWPIPERIAVGPLVNYGYHGDVVLPVRLRFSSTATHGKPMRIAADVRWLACKELCVSVRSRLGIDLPITGERQTAAVEWRRLIASARRAAARPMPVGWQAAATVDAARVTLTLRLDRPAASATFFPLDESQIDDAAPQTVTTDGCTLRIHLKTSDQLIGTPAVLRGVVVLPSGAGFDVVAPVASPATPRASRRP